MVKNLNIKKRKREVGKKICFILFKVLRIKVVFFIKELEEMNFLDDDVLWIAEEVIDLKFGFFGY